MNSDFDPQIAIFTINRTEKAIIPDPQSLTAWGLRFTDLTEHKKMTNKTIDINEFIIRKYVESLRPENLEIREQVDIGYSYDGKIVILYEIRPIWNDPKKKEQFGFAKIRYYKSRKKWNLFWMRASGKWEIYEPFPEPPHLEKIIETIKEDKYSCFFG